jgi:hypothetical protein
MSDIKKIPVEVNTLVDLFQLKTEGDCSFLNNWLNANFIFNEFENTFFEQLYERTRKSVNYFNEEELKMHLVGPLLFLVDIDIKDRIKIFYERPLSNIFPEGKLSVVSDCMAATPMGFNKPRHPYFFLQEYKKGRGDDKDPEAQMLAAMLISQQINNDKLPLYGSYVIGNSWRFTTLIDTEYCYSREYNADIKEDLLKIAFILKKLKELILNR